MNSAHHKLFLVLATTAGLALVTGCGPTGTVMDIKDGRLSIAGPNGEYSRTYEVAPDAKITLDGQEAELEDVDPGDSVSVATKQEGEQEVATKVNAWSKEKAAEQQPAPNDLPLGPGSTDLLPEEGAPPTDEGGGAADDEPKLEGEATPPADKDPADKDKDKDAEAEDDSATEKQETQSDAEAGQDK